MKILFLCVANSARSQIAEGLAKVILDNDFQIESAGSAPSGKVHPLAVQVLQEFGIDISHHRSKSIDDLPNEFRRDLGLVVTLCREEQCPFLPGKFKKESWALPDPVNPSVSAQEEIESFRQIRDVIQMKIEKLKAELAT
ncbi:MAG: arsenate reductase ArsC [Bdellovibrionales bacterium]